MASPAHNHERRFRWRDLLLSLTVTAFFSAVLYVRMDVSTFTNSLADIDYALLAPVLALLAAGWWLRTLRWQMLLSPFHSVPAASLFGVVMTGAMVNNLIPGRAGEFWRAHTLGRRQGFSRVTVFGTIVVERLLDGVALVFFASVIVLAVGSSTALTILIGSMIIIFGVALTAIGFLAFSDRIRDWLIEAAVSVVPARHKAFCEDKLGLFTHGLRSLRAGRVLRGTVAVTVLIWLLDSVAYWTLGMAFGLDVDPHSYLLVVAIGNLAIAVPFSVGAIGPFEFFVQQSLGLLGVSSSRALAYAVSIHGLTLAFVTASGLFFVGWGGLRATLAQLRQPKATLAGRDGEAYRNARTEATIKKARPSDAS